MPRIGILVPAFRGGALLRETVASVIPALTGNPDLHLLVVDNASDDGSLEVLRDQFAHPRFLIRVNDTNLGRIGNWNRCLEIAETEGWDQVVFLMVGDLLADGVGLVALGSRLEAIRGTLACFRYSIVSEDGQLVWVARDYLRKAPDTIDATAFARVGVEQGALPFGPLQANLYPIGGPDPIRFQDDDPTHTDQFATIALLLRRKGRVLLDQGCLTSWRQHRGRFHQSMDPAKRIEDDFLMIQRAAERFSFNPDWETICSARLLLTLREYGFLGKRWAGFRGVLSFTRARAGKIPIGRMTTLAFRKFVLGRSLLTLES